MKYKKIMLILITAIFLASIAGVCAADANDTLVASENTNQMDLSSNNEITEDNLKTSEENAPVTQANDAESDSQILSEGEGTYNDLREEIGSGGDKNLAKSYYRYTGGDTIEITTSGVINGNGAVIDMANSGHRAFYVTASGVTIKNLTIKNANYNGDGGAIYFTNSGTVENCNFTNNSASDWGGAVFFLYSGTVTNCNFTNNTATNGNGGAINMGSGTVENCNFTNNTAARGGAIYMSSGSVENCNFTNNTATNGDGGAVFFVWDGTVTNCNFTNNTASRDGGAIDFEGTGTVTNCNFTNNNASSDGGAIFFSDSGTVENCNFTGNNATTGSAIYFYSTSATKTVSNSRFLNNRANAEALDVTKNDNNITIVFTGKDNLLNAIYSRNDAEVTFTNVTYWSANGIANTGNSAIKPSRSNKEAGQNITIGVVVNGELVFSDVKVTDENGMIVLDISAGESYFIGVRHDTDSYYTEKETIISNNTKFNVNVTSQTTNNRTVNITAKSNIPDEVINGKLLFILPNSEEISANYGGNGTWWAVHTFDDYGVYEVNASYTGLDNVTVNNANISITRANSTVNLTDVVLDYGGSTNVTVTAEGATGITAKINDTNVTVVNNFTIPISGFAAGNYTLTVTTMPDGDHNPVTKTVNITVNRVNSTLTVNNIVFDYNAIGSSEVSFTGATGVNAKIIGYDEAIVNVIGNTITVSNLTAGNYILTVTTMADANHNDVTKDAVVIVNRLKTELTADAINVSYNADANLTITLKDIYGNPLANQALLVDFNGAKIYDFTDLNGTIKVSVEGLAANTYTARIIFTGDDNFFKSNATTTVTVSKDSTNLMAGAVTATYNVNKELVITLTDSQGNPIKGVDISVDLNGVKTFTTDANGQIKVATANLAPKVYTAKITFKGNGNYLASSKQVKVTVKKATPKLVAKKKTFKKSKKVKKYTVTLKANSKALAKVKLTLKVKGKTYKAKTNSKGKAVFKIKNLKKKGTFKAKVKFAGNTYYNAVTKTVKIKIK